MKTEINLSAEPRDMKVSITALRKKGLMPAIYYGRKKTATPVVVPAVEFSKILARTGESTVVTLTTAEGPLDSLIYDIDRDPVTDTPRHADFYVFEKGQKMKVKIPLEFIGIAPVVKDLGAVLVKVLHELHVEAAPKDLPHTLAVDLAKLVNFESQILASDIALPD
ncbi:50S ribosomal protein L25, partial [Patescibacteria group bacterium]|nr:50S ribosomal protein L25 [Patescibacteria group bacterium]